MENKHQQQHTERPLFLQGPEHPDQKALFRAIWRENKAEIKSLVEKAGEAGDFLLNQPAGLSLFTEPDTWARYDRGETPLIFAVKRQKWGMAQLLLDMGAEANVVHSGKTALHFAAAKKDGTETAKLLMARGSWVGAVDSRGHKTPLHLAVANCHTETVQLLLDGGAPLNAADKHGDTPLHESGESVQIARMLLNSGAAADAMNRNGETPLHKAAWDGNTEMIETLLNHGGSADLKDGCGRTPLLLAIVSPYATGPLSQPVQALLNRGASANAADRNGRAPLHAVAAVGSGCDENSATIAQLLLDSGANVNVADNEGKTPLHHSVIHGNVNVVRVLIEYGANLCAEEDVGGNSPLHLAVEGSKPTLFKLLLEKDTNGATADAMNNNGETPLHKAAQGSNTEMIEALLDHGVSTDPKDGCGRTPLLLLAAAGPLSQPIQALLNRGASANATDHNGWAPLHAVAVAASGAGYGDENSATVAQLLLDSGADVNVADNEGKTPLHHSVIHGNVDVARVLIGHDANLCAQDICGNTPLHTAVEGSESTLFKLLLEKVTNGATTNVMNNNGETPLHKAARDGSTEMIEALLDHGGSVDLKDKCGRTPLLLAIVSLNATDLLVQALLNRGASANAADRNGRALLHAAAAVDSRYDENYAPVARLLLDNGANVNVTDNEGKTPLHHSVINGNVSVAKVLIERDANPCARDIDGCSPLHFAVEHIALEGDEPTLFELLSEKDEKANAVDHQGQTPPHDVGYHFEPFADSLLAHGAIVDATNNEGKTPLHHAAAHGRLEWVALLLDNGANIEAEDQAGSTPLFYAAGVANQGDSLNTTRLLLERGAGFCINRA